jgi:cysteine desulfurase
VAGVSPDKAQFAALINAESAEDILFVSGGTEAVNLAVKGVAYANQRKGNHIVLCETEHPAVMNSVEFLEKQGFSSTRVKVDSVGCVNAEDVRAVLTDKTILVCVQYANHDIGTIQPIREIGKSALRRAFRFCYAVARGWLPIDVQAMGISLLALSHTGSTAPKVWEYYIEAAKPASSALFTGRAGGGRRAGTENVPAIVGGRLARGSGRSGKCPERIARTAKLRSAFGSTQGDHSYIKLNGRNRAGRISTNLNISTEFIRGRRAAPAV